MSMFQKATKQQLRARVGLAGPTGAGKTWTALEWAQILGKRIALVDTERGRAKLYADYFDFDVVEMHPPFEPRKLEEVIKAAEAEQYDVTVIDSFSHFWEGEGGVLDIADSAGQRSGGNSFAGWKVATPALRHLIDTMLALDSHLIVTMRSKMEYVIEQDSRGKSVPRKVGMAPVMRQGVEYEFDLIGDLDLEHRLVISKSRCKELADKVVQPGQASEAAKQFAKWLDTGEPVASREDRMALLEAMNAIDDQEVRNACKRAFASEFGLPDTLPASRVSEARAFVAMHSSNGAPFDDVPSTVQGKEVSGEHPSGVQNVAGQEPLITDSGSVPASSGKRGK